MSTHWLLFGAVGGCPRGGKALRVVTAAFMAHLHSQLGLRTLPSEQGDNSTAAYAASRLANSLFAQELDRRAKAVGLNLLSVAAHPGNYLGLVADYNLSPRSLPHKPTGPSPSFGEGAREQRRYVLASPSAFHLTPSPVEREN